MTARISSEILGLVVLMGYHSAIPREPSLRWFRRNSTLRDWTETAKRTIALT